MSRPEYLPASIVETETLRIVRQSAKLVTETWRFPVRLIGRPGTGKSCALWQVADEMGGTYCEITAGSKSIKGMFEALLRSAGTPSGKNHVGDIEAEVYYQFRPKERFSDKGFEKTPSLLFVDEVQTLELTAFRELLRLQERCMIALVLAGNKERIAGSKRTPEILEQIESRILPPQHLPGPGRRDCELIGATFNVEGREAYSLLTAFGTETNFRALVQLLEISKRFTVGSMGIRRDHLEAGIQYLKPNTDVLRLLKSEAA